MKNISGRRLLVLGGSPWKQAIKEYADREGLVLAAAGNDPEAGFVSISDEYYNVNSTDSNEMKKLILEKKIDGVYLGGNESVIEAASHYVNDLGLPCYCNPTAFNSLRDKSLFKSLCAKNKLPVLPQYELHEGNIEFPAVTKPADGSGSTGFSVCYNHNDLEAGYKTAKESSFSGGVVIEKYIENDSIVVFYRLSEGRLNYCGMEDKYPSRFPDKEAYVARLLLFESKLSEAFRRKYEEKLQNLFDEIGASEGPVWIEVFYDKGEFYFNEAGYRYGGTVSVFPVEYLSGVNDVCADMYYALTGESVITGFPRSIDSRVPSDLNYAVYCIYLKPGLVGSISGIDELLSLEYIVAIPVYKTPGDRCHESHSFGQIFAIVHFVYDKKEDLYRIVNEIDSKVSVKDSYGQDMVLQMLAVDEMNIR